MHLVVTPDGGIHEFPTEAQATTCAEISGGAWREIRVVTQPSESWKWQRPYKVCEYRLARAKAGHVVWRLWATLTGKVSVSQLRELGHEATKRGSLHNKPATIIFNQR